jgi:hypothetical protein
MKCLLQLEEPRSGQRHHLTPLIDEMDLVDARGRDDHDVPIVLVAVRRRTSGEASVGGLHDHNLTRRDARVQDAPLFD